MSALVDSWGVPLAAEKRLAVFREMARSEDVDPHIRKLVSALNAVPGVVTTGSCGGHQNPKPFQRPAGHWAVHMEFEHSEAGWRGLEFLTWVVYGARGAWNGQVEFGCNAFAPWEEEPGVRLWFTLESTDNASADELADSLNMLREKHLSEKATI